MFKYMHIGGLRFLRIGRLTTIMVHLQSERQIIC
jgi:hypothetical protein